MPQESLDEIMSGKGATAPALDEAPRQETERTPERNRDEHGRFAEAPQPKEPVQEPQQTAPQPQAEPQQQPPPGYVPVQALDARVAKARAEAEERYNAIEAQNRALQMQMQQLVASMQPQKPTTPPPDFFEDPDKAFQYRVQQAIEPLQQGQQGLVERFSRMMAVKDYGDDTVRTAFSELEKRIAQNPAVNGPIYQRIMQAEHPYGELVRWHKEQTALSTYGDDPTAYREKLRQELLAEMQAGNGGGQPVQPQTQHTAQPASMPQSFTQAPNVGSRTAPQWTGPKPLSELMPR